MSADDAPTRRSRDVRQAPDDLAPFPTFDQIARRTYELFTANCIPGESIFDCWRRAEGELLERAASRVIR